MYRLRTAYEFRARHRLPFEEGSESEIHEHGYKVELIVSGPELDDSGFLVDIIRLRSKMEGILSGFQGIFLNAHPDMEGMTPSIENLSRVIWDGILPEVAGTGAELSEIRVWEDDHNWASYCGV